jgi:hypothetical protein
MLDGVDTWLGPRWTNWWQSQSNYQGKITDREIMISGRRQKGREGISVLRLAIVILPRLSDPPPPPPPPPPLAILLSSPSPQQLN